MGQIFSYPGVEIYQHPGPVGSPLTSSVIICHPSGNKASKQLPAWMPQPSKRSLGCGSRSDGSGNCNWLIFKRSYFISIHSISFRVISNLLEFRINLPESSGVPRGALPAPWTSMPPHCFDWYGTLQRFLPLNSQEPLGGSHLHPF